MQLIVNSRILNGPSNIILLQYLKFNGCDVPRFCYHEKLDIAGIVECV